MSKHNIKVANGKYITGATEGPITWPTTATKDGCTFAYDVTDHGFYSNQLSSNLFTPIPLVDKGYGFYLAPWGKSATLTSPQGCDINLIREGNEWRLPPPPSPSITPHTFLASEAASEMARRKEEVWRYWHGVLHHASDRNMHRMSLQN